MEPFHSVGMATHPCYSFNQRMLQCIKGEELSTRMCFQEMEDWYECKSRKKHRAFQNFVSTEMNKMKIYSLPTYDHSTDTFKDGPLPKTADKYFSKEKSF
jgi:hypothetical protein